MSSASDAEHAEHVRMIGLLLHKAVGAWRDGGLREVWQRAAGYLRGQAIDRAFDANRGTDTSEDVPLWKLHIAWPNAKFGTRYQAAEEREIKASVRFLDEDLTQFTFVDLGCGKGRTLLVAAEMGFKQAIGVEFAPELVAIARANLEKTGTQNARVVESDAADFEFPPGKLVVFLYNPFGEPVMRPVIANLARAARDDLYVVYQMPKCAALFDQAGFLENIGGPPGFGKIRVWRSRQGAAATNSG